jgi:hypothetical protein
MHKKIAIAFFAFHFAFSAFQPMHANADDPLRLIFNGTNESATSYHYKGLDVPGFQWDIYLKDYFNDEWRMNKVREYGGVEYYVGNRYVPGSGKRYASSASVYYSSQGVVISFVSQNWQNEKCLVYNMVWQSNSRISGCEYWVGADRFDGYYFRTGYIDLISGTFAGKTKAIVSGKTTAETNKEQQKTGVETLPKEIWGNEELESGLLFRLGSEDFAKLKQEAIEKGLVPNQSNVQNNAAMK